ncbi:VOC family protein [Luteococcus sp.]|uniref:VOC family protein n=1 Tax=Luteococcus sp. TaxID=1969402 RepID=UPI003736BB20
MSNYFNAFDASPVPAPGPDAVAPEPFRGIYAMPMFVTLASPDLAASVDFWTHTLDFFELFSIPGRLVHLRRWAFQDVLLVPSNDPTRVVPGQPLTSFACLLGELDDIANRCRQAGTNVTGPQDTPWNTRDLELTTPEGARIVFTAAKPWDPESDQARNLEAVGIRLARQD